MSHKLQFVGSGSAFTMENFQSNMVFWNDTPDGEHSRLLIDCGSDARHSLAEAGISHRQIGGVYISHLHADHAGGLEWIGFLSHFDPGCDQPELFVSRNLSGPLWHDTLVGGMGSLQCEVADLDTYFRVNRIKPNGSFSWHGTRFQLVQTIHVYDGFVVRFSFGLLFTVGETTVFLTTDTQFCPEQIKDFYDRADLIFHDCETSPFESRVHAHYSKMRELPDDVKGKMWLYHHNDGQLPDAVDDGFLGFVEKGQVFDLG